MICAIFYWLKINDGKKYKTTTTATITTTNIQIATRSFQGKFVLFLGTRYRAYLCFPFQDVFECILGHLVEIFFNVKYKLGTPKKLGTDRSKSFIRENLFLQTI